MMVRRERGSETERDRRDRDRQIETERQRERQRERHEPDVEDHGIVWTCLESCQIIRIQFVPGDLEKRRELWRFVEDRRVLQWSSWWRECQSSQLVEGGGDPPQIKHTHWSICPNCSKDIGPCGKADIIDLLIMSNQLGLRSLFLIERGGEGEGEGEVREGARRKGCNR
jgi:hypothetical protein